MWLRGSLGAPDESQKSGGARRFRWYRVAEEGYIAAVHRAGRLAAGLAALFVAAPADAELASDAAAIEQAISGAGHALEASRTVFVEEGRVLAVAKESQSPCWSVIVASARNVRFAAVVGTRDEDVDDLLSELHVPSDRRLESTAGLLQISGCDAELAEVDRVYVRMLSPRGTLEVRVASGEDRIGSVVERLGRGAGPAAAKGDPGPPMPVTRIADRRQRAESMARADGATNVLATEATGDVVGSGATIVKVVPGCHRFHVLAEATEAAGLLDLDAELRNHEAGGVLARDRGETPDARLETCVGRNTELAIVFAGAPPKGRVVVLDALFPLPLGVSDHWGDRARAALAGALRKRVRRGPARPPLFETIGAQGNMSTGFPTEPGHCYVAALGVMRGTPRGLRLSVQGGARASTEEVPPGVDGTSVVFCSDGAGPARIRVDAPGSGVGWVASVWSLGSP